MTSLLCQPDEKNGGAPGLCPTISNGPRPAAITIGLRPRERLLNLTESCASSASLPGTRKTLRFRIPCVMLGITTTHLSFPYV